MRGQKARSGSGVRHGFEGGQTPLFRRLPKLKGIAGGQCASFLQYHAVSCPVLYGSCGSRHELTVNSDNILQG